MMSKKEIKIRTQISFVIPIALVVLWAISTHYGLGALGDRPN